MVQLILQQPLILGTVLSLLTKAGYGVRCKTAFAVQPAADTE
ncbi:hypothetical protein AB0F91_33160 [Amycolatopsis sp. NPDC023774]